ncbi:MAG TPA: hypothetical protein VFW16_08495, partial [Streptosporangiaceae bacterium]|nr:hypothetical protein [Streptosporangiaceae bacterium]
VGAIGWLAGPATSRRARREQARLTATLTGATPRKGASWVGRRPPGLLPLTPVLPPKPSGPARLRLRAGVPGSAAALPAPSFQARFGRPVRLGLADEQRRRARATSRDARGKGQVSFGANAHGVDRHGLKGAGVPRIAFRATSLPGASGQRPARPATRTTHAIAFGTGSLPGAGRAARRPPPRIAFGTPGRAGQARSGGLIGVGGAAARGPAGRLLASAPHGGRKPKQPRFARPAGHPQARKPKQPRFARSAGGQQARTRQPKTARMSAGRGLLGRLPWARRAGGRSAVWRIGSTRMGGYR